jgi:FYVE zinc finger/Lipase (class 3)
MATTTSETMTTADHNYSHYSADNDGQQQSQLLGESSSGVCTEELILPPPSCWFTDDLAASAADTTPSDYDDSFRNVASYKVDSSDCEQKHEWTGNLEEKATSQIVSDSSQTMASPQQHTCNSINRKDSSSLVFASASPIPMKTHVLDSNGSNNNFPNKSNFQRNPSLSPARVIAAPSPSWKEISSQVLPSAAKELLSSSMRRICYTARISYSKGRWHRKYSEIGNNTGGYFQPDHGIVVNNNNNQTATTFGASASSMEQQLTIGLPPFSSLPWVDRQMVREWRTYLPEEGLTAEEHLEMASPPLDDDADTDDFDKARTLVPQPIQRPLWQKAEICHECLKPFGPTRLRHHCRFCGYSFCQLHSGQVHRLPHLGYDPDVPERVCDPCKRGLLAQNLAERVAWRLARCRDLKAQQLTPYFEMGIDTVEEAAIRMAHMALATARSIPLGAQAHVAVETVEVLRKHGLNGIYGIMLRQEFLAAADLLRKALGINRTAWPLSVHELSAAIFYALAQHRAMRGINPDREEIIHTLMGSQDGSNGGLASTGKLKNIRNDVVIDGTDEYNPAIEQLVPVVDTSVGKANGSSINTGLNGKDTMTCTKAISALPFTPVCTPVADHVLNSLIFYAPIALTFVYAPKEVEMQLLAAQQGWKLLYACLNAENDGMVKDMPASALFVHEQQRTACLAIRGTATIHDVVTDVRQMPVSFPETDPSSGAASHPDGWTNVTQGNGLAVCGMASAAMNLFREHIDVLLHLVQEGYRIRITGHSLGK